MERIRQPFQGVRNIVRFNWHFYVLAAISILVVLFLASFLQQPFKIIAIIVCLLIILTTFISLLVSYYVYDVSNLYTLNWLDSLSIHENSQLVNINAGFDETSILLNKKYPRAELIVFDFYNPLKHTEVSIKRARKTYPAYKHTIEIDTSNLPLEDRYADNIFLVLAAHEIRNAAERTDFFKELSRVLKPSGRIIVVEHLRDMPNLLAYNIGFFHFHSKATWYKTFASANFAVETEIKITPFINTFILTKNGTAS